MKKTTLGRTGIETGVIGLGLEHLEKAPFDEVAAVVEPALEAGAGYMDLFMPSPQIRDFMGRLMKGRRERFQIQGHIGACLTADGQYDRSREPGRSERHAEDLLRRLGTDYLDTLMVHFVDEPSEWAEVSEPGGNLETARRWKREGKARAVGMSGHKVPVAMAAVESGLIDILMFPVNPAFDLLPGGTDLMSLWEKGPYEGLRDAGGKPEWSRRDLLLACERRGVAVVAMKPYAAGWVFWKENPSGIVLTPVQCLEYALTRPAVAVAVPGCKTPGQVHSALSWLTATDAERDCSTTLRQTGWNLSGTCMYCNHCLPCPSGLDIAQITRLLDAARKAGVTPSLEAEYAGLPAPASSCTGCGECDVRCPFGVNPSANMAEAAALFAR